MGFSDLIASVDRSVRNRLGGAIIYTASSGETVTVPGIFDAAFVKVAAGEAGVSSVGPAVFLRLSDLPSDPEDDGGARVTVDGTQYRVREAQRDGLGGVVLYLHRV